MSSVYLSAGEKTMMMTLRSDLCCQSSAKRWASFDELFTSLNVSEFNSQKLNIHVSLIISEVVSVMDYNYIRSM